MLLPQSMSVLHLPCSLKIISLLEISWGSCHWTQPEDHLWHVLTQLAELAAIVGSTNQGKDGATSVQQIAR
eukprot:1211952-Amphidinium_carterae.1